jgi:1-acyl-sn-glycerol-3-phosphate acyltransferase
MVDRLGVLRLAYRLPWLLLHVLVGTPLTVICQSRFGRALRIGGQPLSDITVRWWAGTVCRIFGVRRRQTGTISPGAQLVAANHISWLDIQLLHSMSAMGFVGKAEIRAWPIVGWLAKVGGTVFHERGSHDSASGVVSAMTQRLEEGGKVAIFPEGGILPGDRVKMFHARLFGAAIDTSVPVQPVALRYLRDGANYHDITFLPGEKTLDNFFRLLKQRPCTGEIHVLPVIDSRGKKRRQLAGEAESAVRAAYEGAQIVG